MKFKFNMQQLQSVTVESTIATLLHLVSLPYENA